MKGHLLAARIPGLALLTTTVLSGCGTPATDVDVPTISMRKSLDSMRPVPLANSDQNRKRAKIPEARAPQPVISPPDIRMAYLYEWVDAEGNKYFGAWVAIPVNGYEWVMIDGIRTPIDRLPRTPVQP